MARMTKKGARQVTNDLDKLATLFQDNHDTLGVPSRIAMDFAKRCDLLSDAVERQAGVDRNADYDPAQIGVEKSGPDVQESDEPFMSAQFSQQENRELRELQEGGSLGMGTTTEEQSPTPGVQASFKSLVAALKSGGFDEADAAKALSLATQVITAKGKIPEAFLENIKKKKDEAKGDDDKKDDKKDDDKKEDKKASDYNLFA